MNSPRDDLPLCECRWLEHAAHDQHCPVEFDPKLNEYNLKSADGGYRRIYHCPFCAGRAPKSLRPLMFAVISPEEAVRLHQITKDITNETELRATLGEPAHTFEPGVITADAEAEGHAREVRTAKTFIYDQHSDTASIRATVSRDGRVSISFTGKHLENPS